MHENKNVRQILLFLTISLNVRLSPLAEDFRSGGSQPQLKSPWLGPFWSIGVLQQSTCFPQDITILSVPGMLGWVKPLLAVFSLFCFDNNLKLAEFQVDYTHHDC